jgi:hypothetical protein
LLLAEDHPHLLMNEGSQVNADLLIWRLPRRTLPSPLIAQRENPATLRASRSEQFKQRQLQSRYQASKGCQGWKTG